MSVSQDKNNLVYLVYGRDESYRWEAKFSILSVLRCTSSDAMPSISVYTDEPESFAGWPVEVLALDQPTLDEWTGQQGYLHRRKAVAIRSALMRCARSIFVDTDTFFVAPADRLFERLNHSDWLVDEVEGLWGDWSDQPLYAATACHLRANYQVGDDMYLVNSGVLGLNSQALHIMDRTIELIDELYPMAPAIHIIEQFAVGVAAYGLSKPAEAYDVVRHYYGEKRYWRSILEVFFAAHGEVYSSTLVAALRDVPRSRPKPVWWRRMFFRLVSKALPREQRKSARAAFYAVSLPGDKYSLACRSVYALELLKIGFDASFDTLPLGWRLILSRRQMHDLQVLLEQARSLS